MNKFDRFCARNNKYAIKNLMMYIIAGNVIVLALYMLLPQGALFYSKLTFDAGLILRGEVWRLVTFVFIPMQDNIIFAFFSFYLYFMIGRALEQHWGALKFNLYYLCALILTAAVGMVCGISGFAGTLVSSTYINYSMFFAFAAIYPDFQLLLFFIIPIKMKYLAIVNAAFFVYAIVTSPFPLSMLPIPAFATFLLFFFPDIIRLIRRKGKTTQRKQAYRSKVRESERARPVNRCEVCGRTDAEYPDLQFRYCGRCEGYHCYCEEHLFTHEHRK